MLHPDDLPATQGQVTGIMAGDLQLQFENRYVRKDGRIAHILWTARWLPDRQVRLAVAHDITERKRHESLQAALYAISEAAHAAQSLESLFERIHEIIGRLMVATNFSVVLRDAATAELRYAYHVNERGVPPSAPVCGDARCAEVVRNGSTLLITPDARHGFSVHASSASAPGAVLARRASAVRERGYWRAGAAKLRRRGRLHAHGSRSAAVCLDPGGYRH
jgi:hypothetical protein